MPYVALLRITPRPDHRHDDVYAVGPFDDQPAAHAYGAREARHPHEHYGKFISTAELIDPAAFARIRPAPELRFDRDGDRSGGPTTIPFTTNLGHAGVITHNEDGWLASGTAPNDERFSLMLAGPADDATTAKLRLLRVVQDDRLPSYPPDTPPARNHR